MVLWYQEIVRGILSQRPVYVYTFFMVLSLCESQAKNIVLYFWGILFNILHAKSLVVLLCRGDTRIIAITVWKNLWMFIFKIIVCPQLSINLLELHHRVYFLHISLVLHLVHKVQGDDWKGGIPTTLLN